MTGDPQNQILARLTFASRAIDLVISLLAAQVIYQRIPRHYDFEYILVAVVLGTIVLHLLITQIVLGDRSIGKACLGLSTLESSTRSTPSISCRISQFIKKIRYLGVDGLNANSLPKAACDGRVTITSDLLGTSGHKIHRRPAPGITGAQVPNKTPASLLVKSGPHAGKSISLAPSRRIQLGRDKTWSDIDLTRSGKVSRKHALLRFNRGGWEITDHGTIGSASSNKTYLNSKEVPPGRWMSLQVGDTIQLGDVALSVGR